MKEKKNFADRLKQATKKQWIKFSIVCLLVALFVLWTGYWGVLILIPLFFDSYILKYIPWSFWKKSSNSSFRTFMEWADAIGFALIAVWIINTFFFQNYQIPSSSLEKSLLVGDFLFVSKMTYGTRSPMTPLSFPLAQHTLPILNTKSYIEKPQLKYQRFAGIGDTDIKRGDIVVFNFPAGDTVALNQQAQDFYSLSKVNPNGSEGVRNDRYQYGEIVYRPVDRRENYVKRCMGLPGETIELRDDQVYINGQQVANPEKMQLRYYVQTDGTQISEKLFQELGISKEDYMVYDNSGQGFPLYFDTRVVPYYIKYKQFPNQNDLNWNDSLELEALGFVKKSEQWGISYYLPLTEAMINELNAKLFVLKIVKDKEYIVKYNVSPTKQIDYPFYYPIDYPTKWTRDTYGPLWIPQRGSTITFDNDVDFKVAAYERCIKNYEGNSFEYRDGKVFINGQQADSYTFKFDYYFMMGDNRHNSADSRSWGFVPEDHIVGSPLFVWLSLDKDKSWFGGKIRWNRIFTSAKIK